jgi:hypothetical protein
MNFPGRAGICRFVERIFNAPMLRSKVDRAGAPAAGGSLPP